MDHRKAFAGILPEASTIVNPMSDSDKESSKTRLVGPLVALGISLAVVLSWSANHSIGWAILHGMANWIYVIYYACGYGRPNV